MYKLFSFFSGCGILDLGFEMTPGFEIQIVNEYCGAFIKAYQYSRKKMGLNGPSIDYFQEDVNNFLDYCDEEHPNGRRAELQNYIDEARTDGSLVGFIGGPPCPDFSIAGKQRGKDGENGKLSKSYVDLIIVMQPDFFLFENVKGLWRTKRHRAFFDELRECLNNAGYKTYAKLENALQYGVPQDRDRILMFGVRQDLIDNTKIEGDVLIGFNWETHMIDGFQSLKDIKSLPWPDVEPFHENVITSCPEDVPEILTVEHWFRRNRVRMHPDADRFFQPKAGLEKMRTIPEGDVAKKSYKRLHRWRYSPTAAYGNNEVHLHPYRARRLSVAEAMAIQSLPVEFCMPPDMTLSDCFKTIGNGVPFLMARSIAETIRDYLDTIQ